MACKCVFNAPVGCVKSQAYRAKKDLHGLTFYFILPISIDFSEQRGKKKKKRVGTRLKWKGFKSSVNSSWKKQLKTDLTDGFTCFFIYLKHWFSSFIHRFLIGLKWLLLPHHLFTMLPGHRSGRRLKIGGCRTFSLSQDYSFHIKPIAERADKRPEGKWSPGDERLGVPLLHSSNKPPL